jgi:multidrug efflux system outer membrane protein
VRSLSEAALMEYLATEEAARSVQISLVAEVIQASLAQDSAAAPALALRTLQAREKELQLMSERRKTGTPAALTSRRLKALAGALRSRALRARAAPGRQCSGLAGG